MMNAKDMARRRAYSYNRPLGMGAYPKGYAVADIVNFGYGKQFCDQVGRSCFGYIDFLEDVPTEELERYELVTPEMFEASKQKVPPMNVMFKMAEVYRAGNFEGLEKMYGTAERKGYDMEATDAALGELVRG